MLPHLRKLDRRSGFLLVLFLLLLFLWSSVAEAKERGFWGEVKASVLHAHRQVSSLFQEANRAFLKFFRQDAKEEGKRVGKGMVEAGKETREALKESGKETANALKRSAQETKTNLKKTGKQIREGFR